MNNSLKKGIILSIGASVISGFSIFYNKTLLGGGIDPNTLNIVKNGGTAILLCCLLFFISKNNVKKSYSLHDLFHLFIIGLIGGGIPFLLFFNGLQNTSAINATLIQKSMFIWVAILAVPFLHEKLSSLQLAGYGVLAFSNLFIGGFTGFTGSSAEWMIVGATLFWSAENILVRIFSKRINTWILSASRMTIGTVIILAVTLIQQKSITTIPSNMIIPLIGSILLLTGYVTCWYRALKFAPATLVTSILIAATPITNILSSIFITHTLTLSQTAQIGGTLLGITLITLWSVNEAKKIPSKLSVSI